MKRTLSIILAFLMIIGMLPMNAFEIKAAAESIEDAEVLTDQHTHDYIPVETAPTCTELGYTTLVCDGCGDTKLETKT